MEEKAEWRELLRLWMDRASQDMLEKMLEDVDTTKRNVYRWIKGPTGPDSRRKVMMLERHIPEMGPALKKAFPRYYEVAQDATLRAVAPVFAQVLRAQQTTERSMILQTITSIVLYALVNHLDIEKVGLMAFLGQLRSSRNDGQADQVLIHAWSGHGTNQWFELQAHKSYVASSTSLCAQAVTSGFPVFSSRDRDRVACSAETQYVDQIKSAASYPVLRFGRIAGVIYLASAQEDFFDSTKKETLEHYARMISEAFFDEDFYAKEHITIQASIENAYQQFMQRVKRKNPGMSYEQLKEHAEKVFQEYK
jgi:hypothetical protein